MPLEKREGFVVASGSDGRAAVSRVDVPDGSGGREVAHMRKARDILRQRAEDWKRLEQETPTLYHGFNELMKRYYGCGSLQRKHKELVAVGASVATRCVECLANHAYNAIAAGAKRDEVIEAAAIGVEFGGGPAFVIVREHLLEFLNEIEAMRKE